MQISIAQYAPLGRDTVKVFFRFFKRNHEIHQLDMMAVIGIADAQIPAEFFFRDQDLFDKSLDNMLRNNRCGKIHIGFQLFLKSIKPS